MSCLYWELSSLCCLYVCLEILSTYILFKKTWEKGGRGGEGWRAVLKYALTDLARDWSVVWYLDLSFSVLYMLHWSHMHFGLTLCKSDSINLFAFCTGGMENSVRASPIFSCQIWSCTNAPECSLVQRGCRIPGAASSTDPELINVLGVSWLRNIGRALPHFKINKRN